MNIIDALVVQLVLEPKNFDEAQKKSTAALGELDKNARGIQQTLNSLSSTGSRTGSAVAAGASAGAFGLKNLAVAGLEAFTAFKALEGIIGKVGISADRGAAVSRASWAIGLPGGTKQLDTFIQAVYEVAHVSQDVTIGTLNAYQQRIEENKRTGAWSQEFTEAGRLGIDFQAPITQQIAQIRAALQGKTGPETQAWANAVGLGPLVQYLKINQSQANNAEATASKHSLTTDQGKELERLQTAAVRAENSLTHLWETLSVKFSKSGLSQTLESFSSLIDSLSHDETAMKTLEVTAGAVSVVTGVTLVSGLAKLVFALNSVWATPLMQMLVSGGFWKVMGPVGAFIATMWPSAAGNQSEVDAEKSLGAQSRQMNGVEPQFSGATGSLGALQRAIYENESGSGKNYSNTPYPGHSAIGPMQIMPATFAENALPGERIDNPEDNIRVGNRLIEKLWKKYNGDIDKIAYSYANGSPGAPDRNPGYVAAIRKHLAEHPEWSAPPGIKYNSRGEPYSASLDNMPDKEAANVKAAMATIRTAQSRNKPWYQNNDIDHHIDNITVNTQATDAAGIGAGISDAIKDAIAKNSSAVAP